MEGIFGWGWMSRLKPGPISGATAKANSSQEQRQMQQLSGATADIRADPCGMTNERTDNDKDKSEIQGFFAALRMTM
jgi:hypothetical protein